jgi:hypothetical protein
MSSVHGEFDVAPTESETTSMVGNFPHGSREAPETFVAHATDRSEKARGHTADMHVSGESDSSIVPKKQANKGSVPLSVRRRRMEGRGLTKENARSARGGLLDWTQRQKPRSRGLMGVREAAQRDKQMRFNPPLADCIMSRQSCSGRASSI